MPRPARQPRAYTLVEILVVVVILGIAGALVIPAMGETGIIKVQGAVRQVVSDMTFAQADAVALQERRAVVFTVADSSYALVAVPGSTIDPANNTLFDPTNRTGRYAVDFRDDQYGDARIISADFGPSGANLIFDPLGGPVVSPTSNNAGPGGTVRVRGSGNEFVITVEAFTGRITVAQDRTATP
jgi:prepilin-type N-terminal cleavage/methylation domain-containing protein